MAMEHHYFLMGKFTINGPFSIATLNYQRVAMLEFFGGYQNSQEFPTLKRPRLSMLQWGRKGAAPALGQGSWYPGFNGRWWLKSPFLMDKLWCISPGFIIFHRVSPWHIPSLMRGSTSQWPCNRKRFIGGTYLPNDINMDKPSTGAGILPSAVCEVSENGISLTKSLIYLVWGKILSRKTRA